MGRINLSSIGLRGPGQLWQTSPQAVFIKIKSEGKDTGVNIRKAFMLTLYQRTVSCMIDGVIACTEKKKKLSQAWF